MTSPLQPDEPPKKSGNTMQKRIGPEQCIYCSNKAVSYWCDKVCEPTQLSYAIYKCHGCGSGFVYPIPTQLELSAYYNGELSAREAKLRGMPSNERLTELLREEVKYPNSSLDAARIAAALRLMCAGNQALDVGAGYGFYTQALMRNGFNVEAIEPSKSSRELFVLMNGFEPKDRFFNQSYAASSAERYDVIILSQVFEHLPMDQEPVRYIKDILTEGGICAVAVPHFGSLISKIQGKNDMFLIPPEHINFLTIRGLRTLFEAAGFECIQVETISRYDCRKLYRRFSRLSAPLVVALEAFLRFGDLVNNGMFINAYFRKL
jgi:SAM-dependent methyltransferase